MKNQDKPSASRFPLLRATMGTTRFALAFGAAIILAACSGGPPTPPPPENPAQVKADIQARDEFARNLPKPPER